MAGDYSLVHRAFGASNPSSVGELLAGFFYWLGSGGGCGLDLAESVVSVRNGPTHLAKLAKAETDCW